MAEVSRSRTRWSDESGAELIEFALALPLLLLVGFGIIDFGRLFQRYEVITNAAREGARVAILPGYAQADVVARVEQYLAASGLTAPHAAPSITVSPFAVGTLCTAVTSVTVTYPQTFSMVAGIAGYFGANGLTNRSELTATAAMRNELPANSC
jgi:Flp pilus assembly protein TadG